MPSSPPPGFVIDQPGASPPMPPIPRTIEGPPPLPPTGYRRQGEGLAPIPGGPSDPAHTPPTGYRFKADGSLEAIAGGPADPDRNAGTLSGNPDLTGPEYAASIPNPARRAQAQALVEGRIPWPTGRVATDPHWQQIMADAAQIDPTLDAATAARRRQAIMQFTGNGSAAQRVGSANRLANHLHDLYEASERLVGPDLGQTTLNSLVATVGQSFEPADSSTYDNAVGAVASELERYFRGAGGSTADIDRMISNLSRHQSLSTRRAAIREVVSLIHGAFTPLINQYNDAFQQGTARPQITWLDPGAQRTYRDLGGFDMSLPGAVAPGAPPAGGPPAAPNGSGGPGTPPGSHLAFWDDPARPVPPGAEAFQRDLQDAINRGFFTTPQQIIEYGQRRGFSIEPAQAEAAIRAHGASVAQPEYDRPDISDARGQSGGLSLSVMGVPLVSGQQVDAAARGVADTLSVGMADELSAIGDTVFNGGTYGENLYRERGIDEYDLDHNFLPRLGGQLAGAFALPAGAAQTAGGRMALGGAYGAAYGFGSGEGGLGDRGRNALIGGAIGLATPPAIEGASLLAGRGRDAVRGWQAGRNAGRNALLDAADRQDVSLMRADAGGTGTRMAAGVVGRTFGGIPMVSAGRRSAASAGEAVDRVAADMGTVADVAGAGQAAQRGARSFLDRSKTRADQLLDRVPIRAEQQAQTGATTTALRERTAGMESNPMLSEMFRDPRLEGYLSALESGGLSWGDMRRFRSLIGEMIEQPTVAGERTSVAALRRLYAGISQDLEATAAAVSPEALNGVRRFNRYWRGREARREGVISDILGSDFRAGGEAAFERINRWAQERGGNFANVGRALRSMPAEEANTVRASIFARMGEATAGRQDETGALFSPAEFATQWNRLSERARGFLIPDGGHRAALNDLVLITTRMRRASEFQNYSMTSLGTNALAFISGLSVEPVTAITYALGSMGAGKFLASPPAARWLSQAARARTPQAMRSQIGRLSAVAARDPAIAQEALGLRQMLLRAGNDNVSLGQAAASDNPGENQQER